MTFTIRSVLLLIAVILMLLSAFGIGSRWTYPK